MRFMLIAVIVALPFLALAGGEGEEVTYSAEGTTLKGYLAYDPEMKGKRPGILVVHEWWGHNEHARERARMLAELGYTALAVDMYGEGRTADHPGDAGKFAGEVMKNAPVARARFLAALDLLRNHETVDAGRIGAIGFCFGGSVVLNMARAGMDLKAVVSFHGGLGTDAPAKPGAVKAKILVCHGADDSFVSPEEIEAFKKEMKSAKVDYTFKSYPGAIHAFTNPAATETGKTFDIPLAYHEKADGDSWNDMKAFLQRVFRK